MTAPTFGHDAHLGTGNGLVQFVCCTRSEQPFDMLWMAPNGTWAANVFHTPRQAYEAVARHLTRGQDPATVEPVLEAADALVGPKGDARIGIQHLAEHLNDVDLNVTVR